MRNAHSVVPFGLVSIILLVLAGPVGCTPNSGTGGTGTLFNPPPTVALTIDVDRGVAPLTVQFSSAGSTDNGVIVQRLWNFGDGGTSQEISPSHTYTVTGNFVAQLTLTDDQGASASKTVTIIVAEQPVAIIRVDRTSALSAPAVFNFDGSASFAPDAQPGDVLEYSWDFGDGSRETIPVVAHTFATAGTFRVRLTVTNVQGITGSTETLIDVGIPRPMIQFRSPTSAVGNIVVTNGSPLWVHAVFEVSPGVPYMLRAGLDGDEDECNALVALYDAGSGIETGRLLGQGDAIRSAVFSPDGTRVLSGGDDGLVLLCDAVIGDVLTQYSGTGAAVEAVAFDPNGARFLSGYADGTLLLRDTSTGNTIRSFVGHTSAVNAVAISADGSQILSGDSAGHAILWNSAAGTIAFQFDHGGAAVNAVAFSPTDPQHVATGSNDQFARLWSTATGTVTQEFGPVFSGGVQIAGHSGPVTSVAFSANGALLLTGSRDRTAKLWNVASGADIRTFSGHTGAVNCARFSPDNSRIITGSDDASAIIWIAADATQIRQLTPCSSPISAVAFAPDGQSVLAAVAAHNDIQLDSDPPSGNDLNLTVPTALSLPTGQVSPGKYFLWIEVDTPLTIPSRTYSDVQVNVVPPFVSSFSAPSTIPTVPLVSMRDPTTNVTQALARVVFPTTHNRQIFSVGSLAAGDRLFLSLLTTPGYGQTYSQQGLDPHSFPGLTASFLDPGFSLMVLDANQKLYAWYEAGRILFSPNAKLLIGHSSTYYLVLDDTSGTLVPSVSVGVQRHFASGSQPHQQYLFLNFDGATNISVANSSLFDVEGWNFTLNPVKQAILDRVNAVLAPYNVTASISPPPLATQAKTTFYFDAAGTGLLTASINGQAIDPNQLDFFGLGNYTDPPQFDPGRTGGDRREHDYRRGWHSPGSGPADRQLRPAPLWAGCGPS